MRKNIVRGKYSPVMVELFDHSGVLMYLDIALPVLLAVASHVSLSLPFPFRSINMQLSNKELGHVWMGDRSSGKDHSGASYRSVFENRWTPI
jgi:hypothetical protein